MDSREPLWVRVSTVPLRGAYLKARCPHGALKLHCTQREVRIEEFVEQALREKLRREGR